MNGNQNKRDGIIWICGECDEHCRYISFSNKIKPVMFKDKVKPEFCNKDKFRILKEKRIYK